MPSHPRPLVVLTIIGAVAFLTDCDRKDEEAASTGVKDSKAERPREPGGGPPSRAGASPLLLDWPNLSAENAVALRDELRAEPARWRSSLGPFYRAWAVVDPVAALASAAEEGSQSAGATTMVLSGWASMDAGAAMDWLVQQGPGAQRESYSAGLVQGWPEERLTDLADRITGLAQDGDPGSLPVRLAARWLHHDPAAAAEWLGEFPPGESARQATALLFQEWGTADPTAAGEFLANNPDKPNWDVAASAYAKAVVPDDPDAAAQWAEAIADPALREQIREAIPSLREGPGPGEPALPTGPGRVGEE